MFCWFYFFILRNHYFFYNPQYCCCQVKLYQTHWWRCNGPCQKRRPHFGIVRRTANRPPGPTDYWWKHHQRICGGKFIKIKEPESTKASSKKTSSKTNTNNIKKTITGKPNADITKYINNNTNKNINSVSGTNGTVKKPVLKDSNVITSSAIPKTNKSDPVFKPPQSPVPVFTGNGYTINSNKPITDSTSVTEHVRNIWANKQIPTVINKAPTKKAITNNFVKEPGKKVGTSNPYKHKAETVGGQTPPAKIKKIDDYFKVSATSVLKDLYGEDFKLTQSSSSKKLVAVSVKEELVDCPVCTAKVDSKLINRHLDECLNKDIIDKLSQDSPVVQEVAPSQSNAGRDRLKEIVGPVQTIPPFKGKQTENNIVNLANHNHLVKDDTVINDDVVRDRKRRNTEVQAVTQEQQDFFTAVQGKLNKILESQNKTTITAQSTNIKNTVNIRRSDSFVTKNRGDDLIEIIKTEPATTSKESNGNTDMNEKEPSPGTSKDTLEILTQTCPCCGNVFDKTMEEHLEECLALFDNNNSVPVEGASPSYSNNTTIVIDDDDDDIFDESQLLNATGTKTPCPCCMKMVEQADMNEHLDVCLGLK